MSAAPTNLDSDGLTTAPSRIFLSKDDINSMDKQQLLANWYKQEAYINWLESQLLASQLDSDEKPKLSVANTDLTPRENALHVRLSAKEQEIQDLLLQIQELKASQIVHSGSIHATFLDPSVNILIQNLREELSKAKSAQEETQNELNAWKFTPDSNTGKRLMAKCRLLYQENEELGKMISSGRLAKLEGELALQKNFSEEMKKSQSELDEFLLELDEDVEGMQSTIYFLQQQLRQTRDQLSATQTELEQFKNPGKSTKQEATDDEKSDNLLIVDQQAASPRPTKETSENCSVENSPRTTPDDNHIAKDCEADKSMEEVTDCSATQ